MANTILWVLMASASHAVLTASSVTLQVIAVNAITIFTSQSQQQELIHHVQLVLSHTVPSAIQQAAPNAMLVTNLPMPITLLPAQRIPHATMALC